MSKYEVASGEHEVGSEEDDDSDNGLQPPELQGVLSKWTNYIHGWQSRYIVLKDGTLSYYKSKDEKGFGCRGALSLFKATIKPHEFDECRFDVAVNDCVWYLRAESPEDKQHWVEILEAFKTESGYGSESSLKRHGSAVSLTSATLSANSSNSFKKGREKAVAKGKMSAVDFKGEAMTFKATSSAVLSGLAQCIEIVCHREELWRKRLEKERQRLIKMEQSCQPLNRKHSLVGGPDQEEGPHSILGDEEFYDAVETGLERIEMEAALRARLSDCSLCDVPQTPGNASNHPLWEEIDKVTKEQVHYASLGIGLEGPWHLFAEEGDMKMYRREEELNGLVIDPLRACHIVKGVTGHEMCHYFFSPQYRKDWETTLEQMTVVEKITDEKMVFLQVYKRIWPTAQRDALFWSHLTNLPDPNDHDSDVWAVVNHSTYLPQYPAKGNKCVRVILTVCLYCQTLITPPKDGAEVTRDDITCKITYCSVVNPGGWVPASALRAVYKREYPRFLKRFTSYVLAQTKDKPILF
ncbi:collagen type IV alpha-3-binding protein isoform X2 [Cimex lectularius]|uniref:Ceramide transfer protein n=1 Tax=Cimex lectularius TaxID=79782 RepID=A0A8I6SFR3_CIMLE|nr:collagen type IV alpha-3-binding protein isoform X2 [Cimex lectularius]